jgi:hypothetical protein
MPQQDIVYDDQYLNSLEALDTPDETTAFDPDAEYNRPAPPVPDGWYQAKLSNAGVYVDGKPVPYRSAQWKNEHKPHFEMAVKAELISDDPIINGKHAYTGFPLTTTPDPDRNNASGVSAAYRAVTGKPITGLPGLTHVKQLDDELKAQPLAWVRVQNVLRDSDAEKAAAESGGTRPKTIYGQKKIMALKGGTDSQGRFTGAADHPETGTRCAARPQIAEFKPLSFDPAKK